MPKSITELIQDQNNNAEQLQQAINNYKKSPLERKTLTYIQKQLDNIDALWKSFESLDKRFRNELPEGHAYFKEDIYAAIGERYNAVRTKMEAEIAEIRKSTSTTITNKSSTSTTPEVHQGIAMATEITKQKTVISTVQGLLDQVLRSSNVSVQFYKTKLKTIEQHWKHVTMLHEKLFTLPSYDYDTYIQVEEQVTNGIIQIEERMMAGETTSTRNSNMNGDTNLQLPKIELPKFDGNYLKWRNFYDLFSELVDKRPISPCQKLLYLKSSLSGEAEGLIHNFATTANNYNIAFTMLKNRYENKRVLVNTLLKKLLSQPSSSQESVSSLKLLHDTTQESLQSLQNLGISIENWDPFMLHILVQRLSKATHVLWEQSLTDPQTLPKLSDFLDFIKTRFQSLEALGDKSTPHHPSKQIHSFGVSIPTNGNCVVCQAWHPLFKCESFLKMIPKERLRMVQKAKLCVNCLRSGHNSKNCKSSHCTKCPDKHNTLLHLGSHDSKAQRYSTKEQQPVTNSGVQLAATAVGTYCPHSSSVLLSTVYVNVTDSLGQKHRCRALLDSGSQANFISKGLANKLGLQITADMIGIEGIGQTQTHTSGRINLEISSTTTGFSKRIEVHVIPKIVSAQPIQQLNIDKWKIPSNIHLSDVHFATPSRVDMLIGAGIFYSILSIGQIPLGVGLPVLQNTLLGWVVGGEYSNNYCGKKLHCGVGIETNLDESLEKFWKLEELEPRSRSFTANEMRCENHFLQHVRKHTDGRYIVKLPFKINPQQLGESKDIALQRFKAIERKLDKNPHIRAEYNKFMQEYESLKHMEEIPINQIPDNHYFLPHHAVFKLDSTTTKTRVVFDASAKTSTNFSLNDLLFTGPTIQADVFTNILRFRFPRYAFTADIEKMYRQVWVSEEDRNFQLIWWRENSNLPLRCMRLATITYGTTCAPYLATRILQYIADNNQETYPLAVKALKNNFYVDDILAGSDKISTTLELQTQLKNVLKLSGLNLRKWCANDERLLRSIPASEREVSLDMPGSSEENIKTMGITWFPKKDVFAIKITQENSSKITKRTALADISRLFDPLGLVAPVVVTAKIFLQQLWKLQLDWDAAVPHDLHTRWLQFREELASLQKINIPRHIFNHTLPKDVQLHIFADASELAYGAAAYVRSVDPLNVVIVRLLCSKSRVAPVKQITLPRLELCAAKLATDLAARLKEDKILLNCETFFWSDSTAVLGWINASSSNYHTFVANRISAIQQASTPQQWHHVRTDQNPADLISRGLMPELLINNSLWFYGPLFLHAPMTSWPLQPPRHNCEIELRQKTLLSATAVPNTASYFETIKHGNSLRKLQRIMAYVLRFTKFVKGRSTSKKSAARGDNAPTPPSAIEMEDALILLVKISQQQDFADDIRNLHKNKCVQHNSNISSLTPFIDQNGILRVGGRLQASNLSYDAKHQMLLSYHHTFTKMLFNTIHMENKHVGTQTLLYIVRQRFWPLKGNNIARSTIHSCIFCTKRKPKLFEQLMGALPKDRVHPARPFINAGVDFFGPVWVHFKIRGKKPLKSYVAVFCCFATKAVHLELVSDLSTEAFLGALRRFMARRGHCNKLYCDNATNFVGAKNQLKELNDVLFPGKAQQKIYNECSKRNVQFSFIPPRAPHFGGLWEAAVKSAKHLLYSSLTVAKLTQEEMITVLAETEAIMNSRPLTPMSSDPLDLSALTPGHFLIGEPLTATTDPHAFDQHLQPLTRWKSVTHIKKEFWKRWTNEYLHTLQHRYKWKKEVHDITPGTMVLIKDDNIPSFEWSLGRIKNVIRGDDGLVRVADVQTKRNIVRRPITKLAPLPTDNDFTKEIPAPTDIASDENQIHSPKRLKLSSSVLSILCVMLLMLPICLGNSVEIHPFSKNPGIYFERLGSAGVSTSEWNLISYIDMKSYWERFKVLKNYPAAIQKVSNGSHSVHGKTIVRLIEELLNEIAQQNQLLQSSKNARSKRGAFNVVGNVANALFGVLDANYAQEMEKTIQQLTQNEKYLVAHIRNQTSFLDATINILKKNQEQIDHEIQQIATVFNQLQNQQVIAEATTELEIQATLDMLQFERIQDSLIEILVSSHHGKISPELISPRQLQIELNNIKANLPNHIRLPASTDDLLKFYKLMTIEGRSTGNYVIFKITIPLLINEEFELLKLTSIPWVSDGMFYKIQSKVVFLVINLHRDQYLPLTETELSSCILTSTETYLCHQQHPLYKKGSLTALCEVQLLQSTNRNSSCHVISSDPGPHWFQLHNPNIWLYSVGNNYTINTVCGSTPGQLTLIASGTLVLQADCSIKQPKLTIQGYQKFHTTRHQSYIPTTDVRQLVRNPLNNSLQFQLTSSLNLNEMHKKLSQIQVELPNIVRPHDIHHYTISYICLAAVIIIAYIMFQKFRTRKYIAPPIEHQAANEDNPNDDQFIRIPV